MSKITKVTVHGGHNPDGKTACGAVGLIKESTEDRIITKKVVSLLKNNGITTTNCTVDNGTSQTDVLKKICEKCNTAGADLDISIHFNAGANDKSGNGKTTGSEVLVTANEGVKGSVATKICANLAALGFKNRGVKINKNLYFLNHTKAPALLVEVCFVDDKDDVTLYSKDKDAIATAIANAILQYNGVSTSSSSSSSKSTSSSSSSSKKTTSTTTTTSTSTTSTTSNAKTIWNALSAAGYNDYAVAGIMGNLKAESGLEPTNLQNSYNKSLNMTDAQYTAAVDDGSYKNFIHDSAGYGLAQWTYYSLKEALQKYATSKKKSIGDLDMQVAFLIQQLQANSTITKALASATSVKSASDTILTKYERPADQSDSVKTKRASYGEEFYKTYAGTTSKSSSSSSTTKKTTTTTTTTSTFESYKVRVDIDDLNIRTGPGTNYSKTGKTTGKGVFTIVEESTGKGATKWGRLKSGTSQWISLDFATKV